MDDLRHDLHSAVRSLRKDRRFTAVATITLGLTIAGVALMLTLVHSVLLKPLPYPDSDRLVIVWEKDPRFPLARGRELRTADFQDWRKRNRSFESIALYRRSVYDIDTEADAVRAEVWSVTPSLFPMLGARPLIGRTLMPEDELPDSTPVAILSYEFWQARFNGNPNVLGKTLTLPGKVVVTIAGVLSRGFQAPAVGSMAAGVQVGLQAEPTFPAIWQAYRPTAAELANRNRGSHTGIARLKPDVTKEMAIADVTTINRELAADFPNTNRDIIPSISPLIEELSGQFKSVLWILLAAVVFVLMIGIGNLANLQMVRNSARDREFSIRTALGASRMRLVRLLVTESVLLVAAGGMIGTVVVAAGIRILVTMLPAGFPRVDEIAVDKSVLVYLVLICAVAAGVLGGIPSLRIWRANLIESLRETIHSATGNHRRAGLRHVVIATETALAFILLIGAGLLFSSWLRLMTTPSGMDETNVWATSTTLPAKYHSSADQIAFFLKALDSVRESPAVDSAGLVTAPPIAGLEMMWPDVKPEENSTLRTGVTLSLRTVTPDYFKALRIPLLKGRFFSDFDTDKKQRVGVLNESAVRALFPAEDPIGKTVASNGTKYTILGVIADLKMRRLDLAPSPQLYASYLQVPAGSEVPVTLMIRSRRAGANMGSIIQTAITSLDRDVQVATTTMSDVRWLKTSAERFRTMLLLVFATTALFLALIGIFGVVSYAVAQRTREIGIRMAIGANGGSVTGLMTRQSMIPAALGLIAGVIASLWLSRFLAGFLYETTPTDLTTFSTAVLLFFCSAFLASYTPARRAARIDPWTILRHQ